MHALLKITYMLFLIIKTDDLIDELPVEKRHLSKLIIIFRI